MPTLPNRNPGSYLGVEIHCTWPSACFWPDAIRPWDRETYEAYPRVHQRVAGGSLKEIKAEIRRALAA
jgi:hypothetical protein